jgi:hypothetical protein
MIDETRVHCAHSTLPETLNLSGVKTTVPNGLSEYVGTGQRFVEVIQSTEPNVACARHR